MTESQQEILIIAILCLIAFFGLMFLSGCSILPHEECNPCQIYIRDEGCVWVSDSIFSEDGEGEQYCILPPIRCDYKDCRVGQKSYYWWWKK